MTTSIDSFMGEWRWLSNFWLCNVVDANGLVWPSAEHAYQGVKFPAGVMRERVRRAKTAAEAKKLGRGPGVRADWNEIKAGVMLRILLRKFDPQVNPELVEKLLATIDAQLVEGNWWHDTYWGVCSCNHCPVGENRLGHILMQIRAELMEQQ